MHALLVFLGGGTGALLRFLVGLGFLRLGATFPVGTFAINVTGSLGLGLLYGALTHHHPTHPWTLFLGTGVLGGFTTFSTFELEAWSLIQRGEARLAVLYLASSVILGLAATFLGIWLGKRF